jgi:hypothetical protein
MGSPTVVQQLQPSGAAGSSLCALSATTHAMLSGRGGRLHRRVRVRACVYVGTCVWSVLVGLQFDALDEQLADGAEFDHPLFPKLLG